MRIAQNLVLDRAEAVFRTVGVAVGADDVADREAGPLAGRGGGLAHGDGYWMPSRRSSGEVLPVGWERAKWR